MDVRTAPFDNLQVRQAVAMAVDKEFLSRSTGGVIEPGGDLRPIMPQFEESFRANYEYDPEAAKALMTKPGTAKVSLASSSSVGPTTRLSCKGCRPTSLRSVSRSR
jgi:ABC-type transport system substrate-binding protein